MGTFASMYARKNASLVKKYVAGLHLQHANADAHAVQEEVRRLSAKCNDRQRQPRGTAATVLRGFREITCRRSVAREKIWGLSSFAERVWVKWKGRSEASKVVRRDARGKSDCAKTQTFPREICARGHGISLLHNTIPLRPHEHVSVVFLF